jgi:hypothetical protein
MKRSKVKQVVEWLNKHPRWKKRFLNWYTGLHGERCGVCPAVIKTDGRCKVLGGFGAGEFCKNVCNVLWDDVIDDLGTHCPCRMRHKEEVSQVADAIFKAL